MADCGTLLLTDQRSAAITADHPGKAAPLLFATIDETGRPVFDLDECTILTLMEFLRR